MRKLPPLHALRAFEAAARHLHFTNAADELGLTPTAISHQIRLLEDILGTKLFIRQPRPISLTPAGAELLPVLRDALDRIEATLNNIATPDHTKPLTLSVTLAFASRWLLPRLAMLQAETQLAISLDARNTPIELTSGAADIAIRYAPKSSAQSHWQQIHQDRFIAVATAEIATRWNASRERATPDAIPLLQYDWSARQMQPPSWQDWFTQTGQTVHHHSTNHRPAQRFSEEAHAIEAAETGQGIVLASELLVMDQLANGQLQRLSDTILPGPYYWIVTAPDHPRSAELARVAAWFLQNMPMQR